MITLIVATRERPNNVVRFVDSLVSTTADYDHLQVLFLVDDDDPDPIRLRVDQLQFISGPRENTPIRINEAWKHVKHDVVGLFGDDIVFKTFGWDRRVVEMFQTWPDRLGVVYGDDGWQHEKLCTHPFLSRRWVETLGYVAHDGFFHYCVDTWTHDVARRVDRLGYMPDVLFEHLHPDAGKATADATRRSRMKFFQHDVDVFNATEQDREKDAERLRQAMGKL